MITIGRGQPATPCHTKETVMLVEKFVDNGNAYEIRVICDGESV